MSKWSKNEGLNLRNSEKKNKSDGEKIILTCGHRKEREIDFDESLLLNLDLKNIENRGKQGIEPDCK